MKTRKLRIILLLLIVTTEAWSQNPSDTCFLGSWHLLTPKTDQLYSFYKNNIYQIQSEFHFTDSIPFFKFDNSAIECGIWKIKKNNFITLTKRHTIPDTYGLIWYDLQYYFFCRDSNLLFSHKKDLAKNNNTIFKFTRTNLATPIELNDNYDFKQFDQNCVYLVNSNNPTNRIKCDNNFAPSLTFIEKDPNSKIEMRTTILTGLLTYSSDSTIKCNLEKRQILTVFRNSNYNDTTINSTEHALGTINIRDIYSVEYNTVKRNQWHNVGFLTGFLSSLAMIASPLISINYKNGGFNSNKFFLIEGAGIIGLSTGIAIGSFNNPRIFKIGSKNRPDKNTWYFDKQVQ